MTDIMLGVSLLLYLFLRIESHEKEEPSKGGESCVYTSAEHVGKEVEHLLLREVGPLALFHRLLEHAEYVFLGGSLLPGYLSVHLVGPELALFHEAQHSTVLREVSTTIRF